MALDRGVLAKIDRRVLAELDDVAGVQAVKVPLSDAVWSVWRRYCEAIGLSMGEGVAGLISHELETVVGDRGVNGAVFVEQLQRQLQERMSGLDARDRELDARAQRQKRRQDRLRVREQQIRRSGMQVGPLLGVAKVGRNERCPCGSGRRYKRCHALTGGPT